MVELRVRARRLPESFGGELRIFVGRAKGGAALRTLRHQRDVLRSLVRRGQWDVLEGVRAGRYRVEEVARIADGSGLDTLHLELRAPGIAPPLEQVVSAFLRSVADEGTRKAYANDLERLKAAVGAETPWNRVGRHDVNDLLDRMREGGSAAHSRNRARTAWSALYTWLMDRDASEAQQQGRTRLLADHPVRSAQKIHIATTRHRFLLVEELDRLLEASPEQMRPQYLSLVYTGMRIGEFLSRRPDEVDLPRRRVRILPRLDWSPKGWPRYDHGVRDIPVQRARLLPALEWYREELAGEERFFVNPRTHRPWSYTAFVVQLKLDLKAAGLAHGRAEAAGITPHTFRHTLGSWLAQRDVQMKKIAKILGDTMPTVDRFYSHLLPSDLDETLNEALA